MHWISRRTPSFCFILSDFYILYQKEVLKPNWLTTLITIEISHMREFIKCCVSLTLTIVQEWIPCPLRWLYTGCRVSLLFVHLSVLSFVPQKVQFPRRPQSVALVAIMSLFHSRRTCKAPAGRLSGSEVDFERLTLIEPLTPRRRRLCLCSRSVSVCSFTLSAFFLSVRHTLNIYWRTLRAKLHMEKYTMKIWVKTQQNKCNLTTHRDILLI